MKSLIIPLIISLSPIAILAILLEVLSRYTRISLGLKIILCVFFLTLNLFAIYYSMTISLEGIGEKFKNLKPNQMRCATGVVTFLYLGIVTLAGIPLLIFTKKRKRAVNNFT
jgi:hypothetical protein